ncbi:MAG: PTS sugar transporter subunit IIA [Balneolaceae bacterium]
MNIHMLLDDSTILVNLQVSNKEELLNKMIDVFDEQVDKNQLEEIRTAVFEREDIMSTGVGKNLAIPHGKVKSIDKNYASFALLKNPIDYNSIDNQPVTMVFLLAGPQSGNSSHIKLLSRISRLMNSSSFREVLAECETSKEIHEAFHREEERHFS